MRVFYKVKEKNNPPPFLSPLWLSGIPLRSGRNVALQRFLTVANNEGRRKFGNCSVVKVNEGGKNFVYDFLLTWSNFSYHLKQ